MCPGTEQREVADDLLISVCVAAMKRLATEGRGQPETQVHLFLDVFFKQDCDHKSVEIHL